MSDTTSHDVVVIGAGAAGLSAVREALNAGLSAAWLEAQMFGGLVLNVNELDGAIAGSGAELSSTWMTDAMEAGGENLEAVASAIERDGDALVVVSDAGRHRARAVIVASGAALKKLGVPGEAELEYKGVSHCADCDGPMFEGQDVVVVGGGDSALQSAMVLSKFCGNVHLVHRGDTFRAQPHWVEAVKGAGNVKVHWHSEVSEVVGTDGVEGARVNGEVIPCSGFFAFVGLKPSSEFLPAEIERDAFGAVKASDAMETSMPGVFAAGIVRSGCGGTLEDAVADGQAAARAVAAKLGALQGA
ncbi:NAD(P)/FAD-dependent oxidoreductase [Caenimonas aquaedulcis]|uniref:FAD-dependent oxidoreductase n=1 Tax=Caenimonas aquaedulcis TaxID=2793270 RepID=A0A931H0W1_9BURK|nr:FAD-dependent oxidoreductase [Caenimonas aquaedulcis]MBG9386414.1 FAD-dependent oxidoreductase [Caenimonas aquaedulcis]